MSSQLDKINPEDGIIFVPNTLENILLQTLTTNQWVTSKEIVHAVKQKYPKNINSQSIMRAVRKIREKTDNFIFTRRNRNATDYKLCPKNDVSNISPFFDIKEEDIIASHKVKKTWRLVP
jgi:hypothetical protein